MSNARFVVSGPPDYYLPSDIDGVEIAPWHSELYMHTDQIPSVLEGTGWRALRRGDRVTLCTVVRGPTDIDFEPFAYVTVELLDEVDAQHTRVVFTDPAPV